MIQIGANDGKTEYSKVGGKDYVFDFLMGNPKWSAVLVEPIPETFEMLKENYAARRDGLAFLNYAVAEDVGYREFYVCGREGKRSSLIKDLTEGEEPRTITVPTLDYENLCRLVGWERVDFVKIDAEGYDPIILAEILRCKEPALIPGVIYWEKGTRDDSQCVDALTDRGFRIFRSGLNKRGAYMDRIAIRADEARKLMDLANEADNRPERAHEAGKRANRAHETGELNRRGCQAAAPEGRGTRPWWALWRRK